MIEENNGQNASQSSDQSTGASLKEKLLPLMRPSGLENGGEFLNPRFTLQANPATGNAYRTMLPSPKADTGQDATEQEPAYVAPIQARDAQGKTLPKYRMGIGQRILATVANFANGFAGNSSAPIYMGPGALNRRYYQDEAYRQQQNDEGQQNARDRYRNAIDWRTIGQDPTTKKWYGKTYGGQKQEVGTPPWAAPEDDNHESGDPENGDVANQVPAPLGVKSIQNASQLFIPTASRQLPKSALAKPAIAPSGSPRNPDSYLLTARHKVTNQRIGSNDGQTWEHLDSPGSSFA